MAEIVGPKAYNDSDIKTGTTPVVPTNANDAVEFIPSYTKEGINFSQTYRNPNYNMGIEFAADEKLIWYRIRGVPVAKQRNVRLGLPSFQVKNGAPEYFFKFLGPLELAETLSHDWAPYESLAASIQTLYGQTGIGALEQLKAWGRGMGLPETAVQGISSEGSFDAFKNTYRNFQASPLNELARMVDSSIKNEEVVPWRVDTPLIYKNTERRTFELVFNLISLEGNNYHDIVEPVRLLQALSSPAKVDGDQPSYNPKVVSPYVFEIITTPVQTAGTNKNSYPLLIIPYAVLKNINPVFKGPWMAGAPTRCELRLSFQELEPVYDTTFKNAGIINPGVK